MAINSKVDVCNMSMGHLGNYGTITSIDTPTNDKERIFSLWYDVSRETLLTLVMPNFALARKECALITTYTGTGDEFGYGYAYQKPNDLVKVLGIGNVEDKENNFSVEGDVILTDENYPDGLPLRYIKNITDVTKMNAPFKELLSWYLANNVALPITQDPNKAALIESKLQAKMMAISSINAQENRPVLKSRSRFREARISGFVGETVKK